MIPAPIMPPPPFFSSQPIRAGSLMQLTEHATIKGRFFGTDAILTGLSAGRIVTIPAGGPTVNPSTMQIRRTSGNGIVRDPAVLTDGRLVASVADGPNLGGASYGGGMPGVPPVVDPNMTLRVENPFLIRLSLPPAIATSPSFPFVDILAPLSGITVVNHDNGVTRTFTGPLWQLQPVEVRPTTRPAAAVSKMDGPEREMFITAGVSP